VIYPEALRRPYQYHAKLLQKLGPKKCAFCGYDDNSSNIAGAHIWPKIEIQHQENLSKNKKIEESNDGENGLWLCTNARSSTPNHHRMFDNHDIIISKNGELKITKSLISDKNKILNIRVDKIGSDAKDRKEILTLKFLKYLKKRNNLLPSPEEDYVSIAETR
jgi:predicted restriction endonuclease